MSVLSAQTEQQVIEALISENALTTEQLTTYKTKAQTEKAPLFSLLVHEKVVSNEQLTKATAQGKQSSICKPQYRKN